MDLKHVEDKGAGKRKKERKKERKNRVMKWNDQRKKEERDAYNVDLRNKKE